MSIPIKTDQLIFSQISGTGISADYATGPSGYINFISGQISGKNIYQGIYRVIDESQTGSFGGGGVANIYEIRFFT